MFCPKCGCPDVLGDECPKCGVFVSKYLSALDKKKAGSVADSTTPAEQPAKIDSADTKLCPQCGLSNIKDDTCPKCGFRFLNLPPLKQPNKTEEEKMSIEQPRKQEPVYSSANNFRNRLNQYGLKDHTAVNIYMFLSFLGAIILLFYGVHVASKWSENTGILLIAIAFASVLFAVIFAGIASDIRDTRNILLEYVKGMHDASSPVDDSNKTNANIPITLSDYENLTADEIYKHAYRFYELRNNEAVLALSNLLKLKFPNSVEAKWARTNFKL